MSLASVVVIEIERNEHSFVYFESKSTNVVDM